MHKSEGWVAIVRYRQNTCMTYGSMYWSNKCLWPLIEIGGLFNQHQMSIYLFIISLKAKIFCLGITTKSFALKVISKKDISTKGIINKMVSPTKKNELREREFIC